MQSFSPQPTRKGSWNTRIRRFDVFPKAADDVKEKASLGAAVTLVGCFVMFVLFVFEIVVFLTPPRQDTMFVDVTRDYPLRLQFNLVFGMLRCTEVNVELLDSFGRLISGGERDIKKTDVDGLEMMRKGRERAKSFWWGLSGPPPTRASAGCHVKGSMLIQKTEGNLHIAAGSASTDHHGEHSHHVHTISMNDLRFNVSHFIYDFNFGPHFRSRKDALAGAYVADESSQVTYHIKVVPTVYETRSGNIVQSAQYSVHEERRRITPNSPTPLPGVFFKWEMSPFMIKYTETPISFPHFLTRLSAIIGGTFVVLGILYKGGLNLFHVFTQKPKAT
ncbi:endoplasmic reticulum-Golgi intermediate compartment protein 3-like [Balamuthia mandrillaris]